jgi:acid ceramidase/N-acylethanolamine-hydrolysing acid amidase
MYELNAFGCTAVVARDSAGKIWFARNLDYGMNNLLLDLVITVNFKFNDATLGISDHFAGFVGSSTLMVPFGYAVSLNQRKASSFEENIKYIMNPQALPVLILFRETLKKARNYESAVAMFSDQMIAAPSYFTIAGMKPDEGIILIRDFEGLVETVRLDEDGNSFFIVQTNSDKGLTDWRREKAIKSLEILGPHRLSLESLLTRVMVNAPTKNVETIFTTVYSVQENLHTITLWDTTKPGQ